MLSLRTGRHRRNNQKWKSYRCVQATAGAACSATATAAASQPLWSQSLRSGLHVHSSGSNTDIYQITLKECIGRPFGAFGGGGGGGVGRIDYSIHTEW